MRRPRSRVIWTGRAVVAVVAAVLVNGALSLLGLTHDAVLVSLLAAATVAASVLAIEAVDATTHTPWTTHRGAARPSSGEDARTAMFRRMVEGHHTSYEQDDTIIWQIGDLARQRLRQVHGLRYADDPERAAALLGPDLAGWVARDRRSPDQQEGRPVRYSHVMLGEVLTRIEEL